MEDVEIGMFCKERPMTPVDYQRPCDGVCSALRKYKKTRNLDNGEKWKCFFPKLLAWIWQKEYYILE